MRAPALGKLVARVATRRRPRQRTPSPSPLSQKAVASHHGQEVGHGAAPQARTRNDRKRVGTQAEEAGKAELDEGKDEEEGSASDGVAELEEEEEAEAAGEAEAAAGKGRGREDKAESEALGFFGKDSPAWHPGAVSCL